MGLALRNGRTVHRDVGFQMREHFSSPFQNKNFIIVHSDGSKGVNPPVGPKKPHQLLNLLVMVTGVHSGGQMIQKKKLYLVLYN
jgi:hypothetical protein